MERFGKWNDISEELKKTIPTLKTNQAVRFQMLNGSDNLHPEAEQRAKQPVIYPRSNIVFKDRIWDPWAGKDKKGAIVDIGIWKEVDDKNNPQSFLSFLPWAYGRQPFDGVFHLIGGRDNDDDMFEFLFLSNLRKDNANARGGNQPEFEMIDPLKTSKSKTKQASSLRMALNAVANMDLGEKKDFAAGMLWPSIDWTEDMLTGKLDEFAMNHSDLFIKNYGDTNKKNKALIGKAAQMDIIRCDTSTGRTLYAKSGVLITKLDIEMGRTWIESLVEFLGKHSSGPKVLTNIKTQLAEAVPVAESEEAE